MTAAPLMVVHKLPRQTLRPTDQPPILQRKLRKHFYSTSFIVSATCSPSCLCRTTNGPTSQPPTSGPTSQPTTTPPTSPPTSGPSSNPSSPPTSGPTSLPTSPPSSAPSSAPSSQPSSDPSTQSSSQSSSQVSSPPPTSLLPSNTTSAPPTTSPPSETPLGLAGNSTTGTFQTTIFSAVSTVVVNGTTSTVCVTSVRTYRLAHCHIDILANPYYSLI